MTNNEKWYWSDFFLSSNVTDDSNNDFSTLLLLTDRQVYNLQKAFANNSSVNANIWKSQLSKIVYSGGFLCRILGPLLKTGLPMIKISHKTLAKIVLMPFRLIAAA